MNIKCSECGADIDPAPSQAAGNPQIKSVPALIDPKTCHVAEHLRRLADWLERGDLSTLTASPDGAVVLLYHSTSKALTATPVGVEVNLPTVRRILQAALTSVGAR